MEDKKNQERGLGRVSHFFLSSPEPAKEKITIQVAAKTLGVSKGTVITYLNNGSLTRIKEDGQIYISKDEVRALNRKPHVKALSGESNSRASVTPKKYEVKRPLSSFGLLENEREHLLRCKASLEAKNQELETLRKEVDTLRRNLQTQASELKGTKARLSELEKGQHKRLLRFKKTTDVRDHEKEETQVRLLALEEELERLKRSWWKRLTVRHKNIAAQ
jgi:chromosome segregation ATPase